MDIWKSHQIPLLQSLWVNFSPFIHMTSLKSVPYPILPRLNGLLQWPYIHLAGILLDIQGPYSHLATARAAPPPPPRQLSTTPTDHTIKLRLPAIAGSTGDAWALCPSPAPVTKTLPPPLFGTMLQRPPGARGILQGSGSASGQPQGEGAGVESLGWSEDASGLVGTHS